MIKEKTLKQLEELENYGGGWYMKFKVNTVFKAINGILYNERQDRDNVCEKVFVYNTIEECVNAAHDWKVVRQQGAGRPAKRKDKHEN